MLSCRYRLMVGFACLTCAFQDCPGHKYSAEKCGNFSWNAWKFFMGQHCKWPSSLLRVFWVGLINMAMPSSKMDGKCNRAMNSERGERFGD